MHRSHRRAAGTGTGTAPALAIAAVIGVLVPAACTASGGTTERTDPLAVARVAAFSCPALPSAAAAGPARPQAGGRLQVVTTVAPITSIVANVAGERADVRGVIPEGQDSHTYEPKPSVAQRMAVADVVFVNGLKLEDPTSAIAAEHLPAGARLVELGTVALSPDQYLYDHSFPRAAGKPNPHLWTNPPMAACYARLAAAAMAAADAANAAYYADNAARFVDNVDELDRRMRAASDAMPPANRKLLTYHDAYAYFAVHYGWDVIGAVQVSSFEEPTPKEIAHLMMQVRALRVPAIFGSEVFPSPVLAQIGRETGVHYVDELRDDDLPGEPGERGHSYLGLMAFDFATMVASLGGDANSLRAFDSSDVAPDRAEYPQ